MVLLIQFIDMRFDFFEKLSKDDARAFLHHFLELESSTIKETAKYSAAEGVVMDFSVKSVPPFMKWIFKNLGSTPQKPDPTVPEWVQNTESYTKNLFEFNEPSKVLIMHGAYYLGESFVKSHGSLHWDIGNIETAEANMPVIKGFQRGLEMAPILVTNNLLRRVTADPSKLSDIEGAIEYWNRDGC
jgi:hypothetical protein